MTVASTEKTPFVVREVGAKGAAPTLPGLRVLQTPDPALLGRTFPLVHRLCFGRETGGEVDIAVNDRLLSRVHGTIAREGDGFTLRDCESTNGTFVNGRRALSSPIQPGNVVRAGDTLFLFTPVTMVPSAADTPGDLLGDSPLMRELRRTIDQTAASALAILVQGETGTGKELIAQRIHAQSGRAGAFVAINCAAIPHALAESIFFGHKRGAFSDAQRDHVGCWQAADRGTLFLDEVGEMPLELQSKVLRLLDGGSFSPLGSNDIVTAQVRIVSATNVDLADAVASGKFRRDLFARLQGVIVHAPALRYRREDILPLVQHFMARAGRATPLHVELAEHLVLGEWSMNVRELQAAAQRLALIETPLLELTDLSKDLQAREAAPTPAPGKARRDPTEAELRAALTKQDGNLQLVADQFGRDRKQVYRWMEKYALSADTFRPPTSRS